LTSKRIFRIASAFAFDTFSKSLVPFAMAHLVRCVMWDHPSRCFFADRSRVMTLCSSPRVLHSDAARLHACLLPRTLFERHPLPPCRNNNFHDPCWAFVGLQHPPIAPKPWPLNHMVAGYAPPFLPPLAPSSSPTHPYSPFLRCPPVLTVLVVISAPVIVSFHFSS
jgi:hypothetical protein